MEHMVTNIICSNFRKNKRSENKKRKLEALLNLVVDNNSDMSGKKRKPAKSSLNESYADLKNELRRYVKQPDTEPSFRLEGLGQRAEIGLKRVIPNREKFHPLFMEDIYHLLLRSLIGNMSPFTLRWAKLGNPSKVSVTVVIVLEGISKKALMQNLSSLASLTSIFKRFVEIASPSMSFSEEMSTVHVISDSHIKKESSYSSMFPQKRNIHLEPQIDPDSFSKLYLLLSPIQLVMENYPLPQSIFKYSRCKDYVFTKDSYSPVTCNSPMFAVDCEMCVTEVGKDELTRIAVVDENLTVLYETLVKPKTRIVDYKTKFSGITKTMMKGVKVDLTQVQSALRELLPPDAILCGHSLNFDLHAMRMIHPYVIDTSIIFNNSGVRGKKDGLKNLVKVQLEEIIQNDKTGHNPVEDAIAAMKLVQLKLRNSVHFGDACLEEDSPDIDAKQDSKSSAEELSVTSASGKETNNADGVDTGLFAKLSKYSKKSCLVGPQRCLDDYKIDASASGVSKCPKSNNKKVLKKTLKHITSCDLLVAHLLFDPSDPESSLIEINEGIKQIYDSCPARTFYSLITSGVDDTKFADIKSSLFMVSIKKDLHTSK